MFVANSRVTAQGQISVPVEIRRRLGITSGSVLEWDDDGGQIVVRRAGRFTSADIHEALFPKQGTKPRPLAELKEGLRQHARNHQAHARNQHESD